MKSINIGQFFGIKVYLHYTWFIVVALISYILATGFFPETFPNHSTSIYWILGIISAVFLFVSVLLHELSHSVVAKRMKLKVASITLFFFGGVASISEEHITPKKEFLMAIAGPLLSLVLAAFFFTTYKFSGIFAVEAISSYLYKINIFIAIFNMVPGFPLDGGRVFRSIIWKITGDFDKATRMASNGGKIFAYFLLFVGLANVFAGSFAGIWFVVLGGFLLLLTTLSYEQSVLHELLKHKKVSDFTEKHLHTDAPDISANTSAYKAFTLLSKSKVTYANVHKGKKFLGIIRRSDLVRYVHKKNMQNFIKKNKLVEVNS